MWEEGHGGVMGGFGESVPQGRSSFTGGVGLEPTIYTGLPRPTPPPGKEGGGAWHGPGRLEEGVACCVLGEHLLDPIHVLRGLVGGPASSGGKNTQK